MAQRDPAVSAAIRNAFAVGVPVSLYGISFGALSVAAGLDVWQTMVLSLLMFSGASQFAVIGVVASGGASAAAAAIAGAGLLGARNGLYALRTAPIVGPGWPKRLLAAHWTIDETTAVAIAQREPAAQRAGFWWTGVIVYAGWNLTTLAGALLGDLMGDPRAWGLDAAAAAAFLGLLWPRLSATQPVVVAIAGCLVAVGLTPLIPPGLPVLAAALVALVIGLTNWFGKREAA